MRTSTGGPGTFSRPAASPSTMSFRIPATAADHRSLFIFERWNPGTTKRSARWARSGSCGGAHRAESRGWRGAGRSVDNRPIATRLLGAVEGAVRLFHQLSCPQRLASAAGHADADAKPQVSRVSPDRHRLGSNRVVHAGHGGGCGGIIGLRHDDRELLAAVAEGHVGPPYHPVPQQAPEPAQDLVSTGVAMG